MRYWNKVNLYLFNFSSFINFILSKNEIKMLTTIREAQLGRAVGGDYNFVRLSALFFSGVIRD